jgi:hypothetical protein
MDPVLARAAVVVAILVAAAIAGAVWRRREGRVRSGGDGYFEEAELDAVGLGGTNATVRALLLGSPTCVPCHSVKQVLAEVSDARSDFTWVSVDAADHLPLTREHHVLRVPTLFVVARDGRIIARTSGVPATREVLQVLDDAGAVG